MPVLTPLEPSSEGSVLVVDLDGTLVATDTLWESTLRLVRLQPKECWRIPLWLLRGRSFFKARVAERQVPDPTRLPYRPEVMERIRLARGAGRRTVLATAAHEKVASAVAGHLGVFDLVISSSETENLKGGRKLARILEIVGSEHFEYVGDHSADLPIWKRSQTACVVGASPRLRKRAAGGGAAVEAIITPTVGVRDVCRAMRVHQWSKNVLLLLPLVLAHRVLEGGALVTALLACLAFSLTASAVYLGNDLWDLEHDRLHPTKRFRPLSSGRISIPFALGLMIALVSVSVALSVLLLPLPFLGVLGAYLGANLLYSGYLKRVLIADVVMLSGFYTLRLWAGGVATGTVLSPWLLMFSVFLFFSLAFIKRYSELRVRALQAGEAVENGRGYHTGDLEILRGVGPASAYLAVMVFALYLQGDEVRALYSSPESLWLLSPLLLYWVTRIWLLAHRGEVDEDPVVFALRDRNSYFVGLLALGVVLFSI